MLSRIGQTLAWTLAILLLLLAVLVTSLRLTLPHMNQFKQEINAWLQQGTGFDISIGDVTGTWRNNHPSLSVSALEVHLPKHPDVKLEVEQIHIQFDLLQSFKTLQPVVADLNLESLALDLRSIDLFALKQPESETSSSPQDSSDRELLDQLDSLLLRQLEDFSLADSNIWYQSVSGESRRLDIEQLRWSNRGEQHLAQGTVTIAETSLNALLVSANFVDHGSLSDISGEFYLSAQDVSVTPWLTQFMREESGIQSGSVSLNTWLTLKRSEPDYALVEVQPSQLVWQKEQQQHELLLESGVFRLEPQTDGWMVSGHSLNLRTDDTQWPDMDIAFDWQRDKQWQLNLSQLDLKAIRPLAQMVPDSKSLNDTLSKLQPNGRVEDIRVSMTAMDVDGLKYSAKVSDLAIEQWELLPGVSQVEARLHGNPTQAKLSIDVIDDVFPYGDVFQAPLNIKQGHVDIVWERDDQGWRLWSDKVTAATPDLQVLGAFRLDFPNQGSPFLSFYAEADAYNAGQTWRYLPTLALGQDLTDYLSSAIQGGRVNTAKLVWYGELDTFPYPNREGVFQAWVQLQDGKFAFDTAWPTITDLQLDLLFENDAMYLESKSAKLNGVRARRISGRIPELVEDGHIEIEATASGSGKAVRDYMMATPLVDTVGAALTTLQVSGPVKSSFKLKIPFDVDIDPRAWGYADLKGNTVNIETPAMTLNNVGGRVYFDNDVISASGLSAKLLDQDISLDFNGEAADAGAYHVGIHVVGDWDVDPLAPYVGDHWIDPLDGHVPWLMEVDLQLNDVGFTYQLDLDTELKFVGSRYPYPLAKSQGDAGRARLQASGNQEAITARLQVPNAKYQTEIDISGDIPVLTATNLVLGSGGFKISPVVGHNATIRTKRFVLEDWLDVLLPPDSGHSSKNEPSSMPEIPIPTRIRLEAETLELPEAILLHDVKMLARKKNLNWRIDLESQEAEGQASYLQPYDLSVSLDRLQIYVPALDNQAKDEGALSAEENDNTPLISPQDRHFHDAMPNLTLNIDDFWLQGYKIGHLTADVQRQDDKLAWKKITMRSGTNQVEMSGWWRLTSDESHSFLKVFVAGENNSDLMERFGITSGIQKAPFKLSASAEWHGSPWSMQVDSLSGTVKTEFGKGIVSDVSGAARLLGLFSLDSIIRKMQLDFSDVFDEGMAFNSITGSGDIRKGIFITNDIAMDALAGYMEIKGLADLNTRTVDAEVSFVPDITSGLPTLTAFAVAPQAAIYVLAISTVISPVVEVFTEVNYQVKGPLDDPEVKEISRSRGEFTLPEEMRSKVK